MHGQLLHLTPGSVPFLQVSWFIRILFCLQSSGVIILDAGELGRRTKPFCGSLNHLFFDN